MCVWWDCVLKNPELLRWLRGFNSAAMCKTPSCSGFFTILVLPLILGQAKYTVKIAFVSLLQCLNFLSNPKEYRKINKQKRDQIEMHSILAALGLLSLCCTFKCKKSWFLPRWGGYSREGEPSRGYFAFYLLHRFYCVFVHSLLFSLV